LWKGLGKGGKKRSFPKKMRQPLPADGWHRTRGIERIRRAEHELDPLLSGRRACARNTNAKRNAQEQGVRVFGRAERAAMAYSFTAAAVAKG
jgi:hypothetical protein